MSINPDQHNGQDQQQRGQRQAQHLQQQSKRLLVGKGSINVRGLAAAKKLTKKSVFCIDNVNTAFSADDLRSFRASRSNRDAGATRLNRSSTGKLFDCVWSLMIVSDFWMIDTGRSQ